MGGEREREFEPKTGALGLPAFDTDLTAVKVFDDPFADGEAESGAATLMAGSGSGADLGEWFKQILLILWANPDTGVGDLESQTGLLVVTFQAKDGKSDASLSSEFERVAHQVEDYLTKPTRIGMERRRHLGCDFEGEL